MLAGSGGIRGGLEVMKAVTLRLLQARMYSTQAVKWY